MFGEKRIITSLGEEYVIGIKTEDAIRKAIHEPLWKEAHNDQDRIQPTVLTIYIDLKKLCIAWALFVHVENKKRDSQGNWLIGEFQVRFYCLPIEQGNMKVEQMRQTIAFTIDRTNDSENYLSIPDIVGKIKYHQIVKSYLAKNDSENNHLPTSNCKNILIST